MAVTTEEFKNGTGSATEFTFAFPYLQEADVKVATYANDTWTETTAFTFKNATTIKFNSAPASGTGNIRIYRDTFVDTAKGIYSPGSTIRAQDLNDNQDQVLYALQEKQSNLLVNPQLGSNSVKSAQIVDGSIVDGDINASAEIAVSKLKDGTSRQLLQTADNGNDVEWTNNVKVPGTFQSVGAGQFDSTVTIAGALTLNSTSTLTGNVTVGGTVDGRDLAADGAKLDGIEPGATGDQTAAEIKTLVGNATDSNVFTDTEKTKLSGIATGAEVNVQSDWNASSGDAQIINKPTLVTGLNDLSDVNTSGAANGKILKHNGSSWVVGDDASGSGGSATFVGLSDTPTDFTNAGDKWVAVKSDASALEFVSAPVGFKTIAISGQNSVVADGVDDTLTLAAGSNITLTTNDSNDTVTIASSGGGGGGGGDANQNAFSNVAVSGQTTVAADTTTDTLTLVAGSNVTITTDASADSVTIAASGGGGSALTVSNDGSDTGDDATTINFTGAGVTASGSGATKTITIPGTATSFVDLSLRNAANNGAASYPATDFTLCTDASDASSTVTPSAANHLIVSVNGVIQKPNTGTSTPANGYALDGTTIKFGDNVSAAPDFIIHAVASGVGTPSANTVGLDELEHGTEGDILVYGSSGTPARLAKDAGKYLKSNASGAPSWETVSAGTTTFVGLSDTPANFTNQAGKHIRVNSGANALEFVDAPSGTITALNNQTANRLTTIGATTTELDGEANLTFDGSTLAVTGNQTVSKQISAVGFEAPAEVAADWSIAAANNAMYPGPMTVASGITVTVPANRTLTIV